VHDLMSDTVRQLGDARTKPKLWAGDEPQWNPDGTEIFVPMAPAVPHSLQDSASSASAARETSPRIYRAGRELEEGVPAGDDGAVTAILMTENNATLAAIDTASGAMRVVVPNDADPHPSVLRLSPTGRWLAYLSVFRMPAAGQTASFHDLAVVPANGGAIRVIEPDLPVTENESQLDAFIWHPNRDQLFWVKGERLWTLDLSDPSARPEPLAPQLKGVASRPLVLTRDGAALIAGVRPIDLRDYRDPYPQGLALVPIADDASRVIDFPQGFVFEDVVTQRTSIAWQPQKGALTVLGRDAATAEMTAVRLHFDSGRARPLWKGLARLQPVGATADHSRLIAAFEDLNTPVNFYAFDSKVERKARMSSIEPRLAGMRFGPVEIFETTVPQYDGSTAKVTTAVMLPAGARRGERLPAVVFLYPGGRVSTSAAEFGGGSPATIPVSLFTTRGYAVLLAELPIGPYGKAGNPVSEMVDVLVPQVYHAAELGYADIERVAIAGHSYGGYGTASVISGTNLFRAAIAISGMYDLPGSYAWMSRQGVNIASRWSEGGQGRMGTHPWNDLQRYIENSPYYRADRIRTPLLMLHGAADQGCPVEDARKMFNALKRLGGTVQLAEYAAEGHVVSDWSLLNAVDTADRAVRFLNEYLREDRH
jgi:acetyl esterase/lipase